MGLFKVETQEKKKLIQVNLKESQTNKRMIQEREEKIPSIHKIK